MLQELEAEEYRRKGINLTPDLWLVKLMVRLAEVSGAGVLAACCVWGSTPVLTGHPLATLLCTCEGLLIAGVSCAGHSYHAVLVCCTAWHCCLRLCMASCHVLLGPSGPLLPLQIQKQCPLHAA